MTSRKFLSKCMAEAVEQDNDDTHLEEQHMVDDGDKCGKGEVLKRKNKKKRSHNDSSDADRRGVCYLSRVPPHMNPSHIRLILSKFGDIQRIYLVPEGNHIVGLAIYIF